MSKRFIPIVTADILWHQNLPFSNQYDELYYSADNGIEQSRHIFIEGNDLLNRWQRLPKDYNTSFNIGETGFGTGLNFLLTWHLWELYAPKTACLHYLSCDKHPLSVADLTKALNNWPVLKEKAGELLKQYPILTPGNHYLSFYEGRVKLTLMLGDVFECFEQLLICADSKLESHLRTASFDAWYLDGFSPKNNEQMWSEPLIKVLTMLSKEGTSLATYTVAPTVKSLLTSYGFNNTEKEGYDGKSHMLIASFVTTNPYRLKHRHTPWHTSYQKIVGSEPWAENEHRINREPDLNLISIKKGALKNHNKSAIVIGAGLAGCFLAHSLSNRGWSVLLVDEENGIGQGGSGNEQAVLFPKLSAFQSPLTEFMLYAFQYAHTLYKKMLKEFQLGTLNGAIALAYNEKEKKAQKEMEQWLALYPELGKLIDPVAASKLSGIHLDLSGIYIPLSGWINSPALCKYLINNKNISVCTNTRVDTLLVDDDQWLVGSHRAPIIILANGYKVNHFMETKHLPIKPMRGQMTMIPATDSTRALKMPVCAEGHVLPQLNGIHHLGATFEQYVNSSAIRDQDDLLNLAKLKQISPSLDWSETVSGNWAGVRASTPDYLPLVGQIAKCDEFLKEYSGLQSNSKRWIPKEGSYYQGLYTCSGFGSRGLTTIPICAEWLAASLNNELSGAPRHLMQALSPARFLRRDIIRGLNTQESLT